MTRADEHRTGLVVERREAVVRLVLDRTDEGNALDLPLAQALLAELQTAEEDPEVRVLTLTGQGRFFCAGGDVKGMARATATERGPFLRDLAGTSARFVTAARQSRLLVIAGVNGVTAGAGMGLLLAADWVLATEDATILAAFSTLGLTPDTGVSAFLPARVGYQRAVELILGGRRLTGVEAVDWGLAQRAVPAAEFPGRLTEAEERFLAVPPQALGPTKQLLRAGTDAPTQDAPGWEAHLDREVESIAELAAHPDSARQIEKFAGGR